MTYFRTTAIENQFYIPHREMNRLQHFKYISWKSMNDAYAFCVARVLDLWHVECLLDIPFGKGYCEVNAMFYPLIEKIEAAAKKQWEKKNNEMECF
jgi:hypothetical protein